jgi:hypothetical protein
MRKPLLLGGLIGAGAAVSLAAVFIVSMSAQRGEAGADWAFVVLLTSPFIVGGGAFVGILVALLIHRMRSSQKGNDERSG